MMERRRQLRVAFVGGIALFLISVLSLSAYSLWRLRAGAMSDGLRVAALHSRSFENLLTQSLRVAEQSAVNALPTGVDLNNQQALGQAFLLALRQTPFLRSMSLQDDAGRIVASSNQANVGLVVPAHDYLPLAKPGTELLRIGRPWWGRDFHSGRESTPGDQVDDESPGFIPITRSVGVGGRVRTLLVAINPDYFFSALTEALHNKSDSADILRYDGVLLLGTGPGKRPGSSFEALVNQLQLSTHESGSYQQDLDGGASALAAFRASPLYPFVVITRLDLDQTLAPWRAEAKTLFTALVPALLAIVLLAVAVYRRLMEAAKHRAEAARLLQINATVFDASSEAIVITDAQANIISANNAFTRITGYTECEVRGCNPRLLASGSHDQTFYAEMWASIATRGAWGGEVLNRRKDGTAFHAYLSISASRDGKGNLQHYVGILGDITARKQNEEQLKLAASVFHTSREGITITQTDGTIVDVNEAFTEITGYRRDEIIGKNPRVLASGRHTKEYYAALWASVLEKGHWYGEIWNRRKDGQIYAEMITISTVRDTAGRPQYYVALFSDITKTKEHEQQLERIAHFDALTSLPNRVLLADRLKQAMFQAQRRGQRLAVVFLDLDGFKQVNDTYGHEAGDQLLMALARRMKEALREGDTLARIGGDEFVAVLADLSNATESMPILHRLLAATSEAVLWNEVPLRVSASLGVTLYPQEDELDADQLQRQADQAMYQAKVAGKDRFHFFDAAHDRSVRDHHESLGRIRAGLQSGEMVLHYQPKVNMRTGHVVGAEALIRWQHPDQGLLAPGMFLPVVENHALAVELDEWVIQAALQQMQAWQRLGLQLRVSVNLGARLLQQHDFVPRVQRILSVYADVNPRDLELEVLETSALKDMDRVSQSMRAAQALGLTFSLDDFGTGYSSLTYVKRLPVSQLKIDQSFVRDMLTDTDDLSILQAVMGLAKAFKQEVIAEGVESAEHGAELVRLGCDLGQGYYISRPMPADDIPIWVEHWQANLGRVEFVSA